jgi:hypothetical protein
LQKSGGNRNGATIFRNRRASKKRARATRSGSPISATSIQLPPNKMRRRGELLMRLEKIFSPRWVISALNREPRFENQVPSGGLRKQHNDLLQEPRV